MSFNGRVFFLSLHLPLCAFKLFSTYCAFIFRSHTKTSKANKKNVGCKINKIMSQWHKLCAILFHTLLRNEWIKDDCSRSRDFFSKDEKHREKNGTQQQHFITTKTIGTTLKQPKRNLVQSATEQNVISCCFSQSFLGTEVDKLRKNCVRARSFQWCVNGENFVFFLFFVLFWFING